MDLVPVSQDAEAALHFDLFLAVIPVEGLSQPGCQAVDERAVQLTQVCQQGAAQEQVIQVDDLLTFGHADDLGAGVIGSGFQATGILPTAPLGKRSYRFCAADPRKARALSVTCSEKARKEVHLPPTREKTGIPPASLPGCDGHG